MFDNPRIISILTEQMENKKDKKLTIGIYNLRRKKKNQNRLKKLIFNLKPKKKKKSTSIEKSKK